MDKLRKLLVFLDYATITFLAVFVLIGIISMACGCKAYRHGGTIVTIGEQTILPEVTDPDTGLAVRVYESIHGARIWSREDTKTTVAYTNTYTNSYFGIFDRNDYTVLAVTVEPVSQTNLPVTASNQTDATGHLPFPSR